MTAKFDVAIIGGGAIGAACARELTLAGRRVVVVERGTPSGEAWRAAAGMLAPQIECVPEQPLFDLGLAGRERYATLAPALLESTGIDIGLWQGGIAHLATAEPAASELRSHVALQRQHGHLADWLDAEEVRQRWPWTGESHGALWAPRDGAVDPVRLVDALLADAERRGAVRVQDEVVALEQQGGRVTGVRGRSVWHAPTVVVASGAWAAGLGGLPRPLAVAPVRGQLAAMAWPAGVEPAIVYNGACYLLHRDGEAIVGSTMEYAGFDAATTPEGLDRLRTAAAAIAPRLADAPFTRTWAGLRPLTPDGLPVIGPEPRLPGLVYACGHGRNGILLAGITGVLVRELLEGAARRDELEAVRPERFYAW